MRSWGFILLRDGYAPRRVMNARDDKIGSGFWKQRFEQRRFLVPATTFCEPDGNKPAGWHWFALGVDRPMFAFAGVWRRWQGPVKKDGSNVDIEVYAFVTTAPTPVTLEINHERSPVLLTTSEAQNAWLTGSVSDARTLIKAFTGDPLQIVQSGAEKRDLSVVADIASAQ